MGVFHVFKIVAEMTWRSAKREGGGSGVGGRINLIAVLLKFLGKDFCKYNRHLKTTTKKFLQLLINVLLKYWMIYKKTDEWYIEWQRMTTSGHFGLISFFRKREEPKTFKEDFEEDLLN